MEETVRVLELMEHTWLAENIQLVQEKEGKKYNWVIMLNYWCQGTNHMQSFQIIVRGTLSLFFSHSCSIFLPPFFLLCIRLPVNVSTTVFPNMTVSLFILNYIYIKLGSWRSLGCSRNPVSYMELEGSLLRSHGPTVLYCEITCIVAKYSEVLEEVLPPSTG